MPKGLKVHWSPTNLDFAPNLMPILIQSDEQETHMYLGVS